MAEKSIADFSIFTNKSQILSTYLYHPDELLMALGKAEAMISLALEDDFMNGDKNRMYHYFWAMSDFIVEATRLCEEMNNRLSGYFADIQSQT